MTKQFFRVIFLFTICNSQFFFCNFSFAQVEKTAGEIDAASAAKNYQHGIELMKKENYKGAIEALNDAVDLDSSKSNYQFQLGLAYYYSRNFPSTISIMKNLLKKFPADVRYYEMLGESYLELRNDNIAEKYLLNAVKLFPKSGSIHSLLGRVEYNHKNLNTAIQYWELGIEAEPNYPSNYFYAAQAYGNTHEQIWAIIYGEIFVNLETNTERTYEILLRLYDWYKQALYIKSPKEKFAMFTDERLHISEKAMKDTMLFHKNFEMAYNNVAQRSMIEFKEKFNTESLMKFRAKFVSLWYSKNFPLDFPNPIFDYQRTVISADFFECYNYWLMSKGDVKSFNDWLEKNKKKYDDFLKWFMAHPLEVNNDNYITRIKMGLKK
jgi:Tfp pilus assembly protein PilF